MRILITRPIDDARPLADALEERGIEVLIEPLLEIRHLEDAEIVLQGVQALLFTSANGVRAFAALSPRRDLKAFTVGDGSAEAARQAGFTQVESAKGDVEALAALAVDRLKAEDGILFHAAGTVTAGDLKARLEGLGYQVRRAQLYEAKIAGALSPETLMNLNLGGIDAVLLFSPRTASTFADLWRAAGSPSLARIQALCLSAAVAREIGNLGWAGVEIADRCWRWWMLPAAKEPKWPDHPSARTRARPLPTGRQKRRQRKPPWPMPHAKRSRVAGRAPGAAPSCSTWC